MTNTKLYWNGTEARGPVERDVPNMNHNNNAWAIASITIFNNYLASLPLVQVREDLKAIWGKEVGVKEEGKDYKTDYECDGCKNSLICNQTDKCNWPDRCIAVPVVKQEDERELLEICTGQSSENPVNQEAVEKDAQDACDKALPMQKYYQSNIGRGLAEAKREGFIMGFTYNQPDKKWTDKDMEGFAEWAWNSKYFLDEDGMWRSFTKHDPAITSSELLNQYIKSKA